MEVSTIQVYWPDKFGDRLITINADEFSPLTHQTDKPSEGDQKPPEGSKPKTEGSKPKTESGKQ
jgi:hypothetical protein